MGRFNAWKRFLEVDVFVSSSWSQQAVGRPSRPTIQEVADDAGVSIGTVSRVLNDRPGVSPVTQRRVQASIAKLDYRPDHAARTLSKTAVTIGISLATGTKRLRPFFMLFLEQLILESQLRGYRFEEVPAGPDGLPAWLPNGVILHGAHEDDPRLRHLRLKRVPFVLVGREPGVSWVAPDDERGGYDATAHLTRLGHDVAYLTALGSDPFARLMRHAWAREGMDVSLVLTDPERTTGLYSIATDEKGERTFSYWRGDSAARRLFSADDIDHALAVAGEADLLFFSLISLAILPEDGREALLGLARDLRGHGGKVAFDSNYRPRLWENAETARVWRDRAVAVASFGLPSLDDEKRLDDTEGPETVRDHWITWGCEEVVVKLGADGIMLPDGTVAEPAAQLHALDTSGAGDAFDAGYLAGRLRGLPPAQAAAHGQRLAGWTVMRHGAIPERDHAAPYEAMVAEARG